ncbi:MAG: adenylyl cyclase [Anaerolineae bacterium]
MKHLIRFIGLLVLLTLVLIGTGALGSREAAAASPAAGNSVVSAPNLGVSTVVFDPSMSTALIQATVDDIYVKQVDNEMGTNRYALLFQPGAYGSGGTPLIVRVGYYTQVSGLGASPTDVVINGHVDVYNRCLSGSCIALDNFWRSVSNLTINVMGLSGCQSSGDFWAVSQAAPMRRVNITGGNLTLMDYCTGPSYASGGFIADSQAGVIINGSQQQWFTRDSNVSIVWTNGVWNQVFSGVVGAPAQCFPSQCTSSGPYTTLQTSPVTRESPFLYVDAYGMYNVFVPALRHNTSGITWGNGPAAGASLSLGAFYLAQPSDSAKKINGALANGKNLLFTPGIYHLDGPIAITRADTVVLGLGFPTLVPNNGVIAMTVADVRGVQLAGFMIDAGLKSSPVLLRVGTTLGVSGAAQNWNDPNDPTTIHDVFFRIGGATLGRATTTLIVNSDNVILDDIWAWRADHGNGVGWTSNTANTGLIVNGNNVTAYGLFVEHYQKTEVIWNGNHGSVRFFQNEMPYDPPSQAAWMESAGVKGYPALKIGNGVTSFSGYGMGSYSFFNQGVDIYADHAFEVPTSLSSGSLHDLLTIFLDATNGKGGILNVVNHTGGSSTVANPDVPVTVISYP